MRNCKLFFKGMELRGGMHRIYPGLIIIADVFGMDTKKAIRLDRKNLTLKGRKAVDAKLHAAVQFFLLKCCKRLEEWEQETEPLSERFDSFVFWVLETSEKQRWLLEHCRKYIHTLTQPIMVLRRENGGFQPTTVLLRDVIDLLPGLAYISNLNEYLSSSQYEFKDKYEYLARKVNEAAERLESELILLDLSLTAVLYQNYWARSFLLISGTNPFEIFTAQAEENHILKVDGETKKRVLLSLGQSGFLYTRWSYQRKGLRRRAPAIEPYSDLAVVRCPAALSGESIAKVHHIISPILRTDEACRKDLSKDAFRERIVNRSDFHALVDYVCEHGPEGEVRTKEHVRERYLALMDEYYDLAAQAVPDTFEEEDT